MNFLVTGLPRSGTAWTANLLSYGRFSFCYHEKEHHDVELPEDHPYQHVGNSSSALVFTEYRAPYANLPLVCIDRDPNDVKESLTMATAHGHIPAVWRDRFEIIVDKYESTKRNANLVISFDDLFTEDGALLLWKEVFGENVHFPKEHFLRLENLNVQLNQWRYDI